MLILDRRLLDAAFGARPDAGPLSVETTHDLWLRAVVLGGQGRYAQARADLLTLGRRTGGRGVTASLGMSTWASFLRQSGRHGEAARFDGAAAAAIERPAAAAAIERPAAAAAIGRPAAAAAFGQGTLPVSAAEALADAWTGLAADALGCGRLALGWRLLGRCEGLLRAYPEQALTRQWIRWHWVSAELALAGADFVRAGEHSDRAVELASAWGSVRHQVKSSLLQCAALTDAGDHGRVVALAREVQVRCGEFDLVPLQWAASLLLVGVTSGTAGVADRDRCAALLRHRGGLFGERPVSGCDDST